MAEAKDIAKYLKTLVKHFAVLEETPDFADVAIYLKPLMHTVCLVWGHSRYYCNSGKIIVLLKEICNLIIQQVSRTTFAIILMSNYIINTGIYCQL